MLTCIYDMFLYISQPSMFSFRVRSPSTFIIHLWIANVREIKITQAVPSWILPMIFKKNLPSEILSVLGKIMAINAYTQEALISKSLHYKKSSPNYSPHMWIFA